MEKSSNAAPTLSARLAGLFYVLSVVVAVLREFAFHHRLGTVAIVVPVLCYFAVSLLLYRILAPVGEAIAICATVFQCVGLSLEWLEYQYRGINIAVVFHGLFCLLTGYLIFKSRFLPQVLGITMMIAGTIWLVYLLPPLARAIAPYNTALGLIGESLPMLWLVVVGISTKRWHEGAIARI